MIAYLWSLRKEFIKYALVGASSFLIDVGLLSILVEGVGVWYLAASVITQTVAIVYHFSLNRAWSFRSNGRITRQGIHYGLLLGWNYLFTTGGLYVGVEYAHLHYLLVRVLTSALQVSWNFFLFKYVVFK